MKRMPAVAGQFYKGEGTALKNEVERLILEVGEKERIIGAVCPHAGFMYSGHVAGAVYAKIELHDTIMLIGPNHTGLGTQFSIFTEGEWLIPTHSFRIDSNIAKKLLESQSMFREDRSAHVYEHSLEVQLPFIAHFSRNVEIVPITVMMATIDECKKAGESIAEVIKESGKDVTIVASTDMSHYVSDSEAKKKDSLAINEILSLNPEGLYNIVKKENISMCGYLPTTIMLYAVLSLGASKAELVKYSTSAETSGDYNHVVGYAGIIVK